MNSLTAANDCQRPILVFTVDCARDTGADNKESLRKTVAPGSKDGVT